MPTLNTNNITLYYEQHGQGPDLLLIAGFTADHTVWHRVIDDLAKQFRVTIFDNRGAGQSDSPKAAYTIDTMADDVLELMDTLNIETTFVLGHSMGGFILQSLLARYASRFTRAILMCSRLGPNPKYELQASVNTELAGRGIDLATLAKNSAVLLFGNDFLSDPKNLEAYLERVKNNPHPQDIVGLQRQRDANNQFDKSAYLSRINTPLFALFGEEDGIAPPQSLSILKDHAKDLKTHVIPSCGHMPQFEKPDVMIDAINMFFN
jgi:3-oxoadipate enol-lactonase